MSSMYLKECKVDYQYQLLYGADSKYIVVFLSVPPFTTAHNMRLGYINTSKLLELNLSQCYDF